MSLLPVVSVWRKTGKTPAGYHPAGELLTRNKYTQSTENLQEGMLELSKTYSSRNWKSSGRKLTAGISAGRIRPRHTLRHTRPLTVGKLRPGRRRGTRPTERGFLPAKRNGEKPGGKLHDPTRACIGTMENPAGGLRD